MALKRHLIQYAKEKKGETLMAYADTTKAKGNLSHQSRPT